MKFSEDDFYKLANFVGYGQMESDIWFVIINEKLDQFEDISSRLQFDQVMDRKLASTTLKKTILEFDVDNLSSEGIGISKLYLQLGKKPTKVSYAQKYMQDLLFAQTHNGLLIPFFPIPENKDLNTNFHDVFPLFESYDKYREKVKKLRLDFFNELLEGRKPKLIFLVGADQENVFADLFTEQNLKDHGFFQAGWDMDMVIVKINSLTELSIEQIIELSKFIHETSLPIDLNKDFGPLKLSMIELEKQKKDAAKKVAFEKRKTTSKHNASDPYCVCELCLKYDR
jgi:hypothetical protein